MPRKSAYKPDGRKTKAFKNYDSLTKKIKNMEATIKMDKVYLNYGTAVSNLLLGPVQAYHLTNTQSWISIFGTDANDGEGNKITYKGLGIDMYFRSFSEPKNISFTVFLVSLTDLIGQNFNVATGALGLVAGFHYYESPSGGQVLLNKKCFKIHTKRRFQLGNNGTALGNPSAMMQFGTERRLYFKVSKNQVFQNPYGDWKDIQAQLDPNKNMYLLVFCNNSGADAQNPALDFNVVHTVQKNL